MYGIMALVLSAARMLTLTVASGIHGSREDEDVCAQVSTVQDA